MILLTGGTGKTGSRIAERLGARARIASRHGPVPFDWQDASTYAGALHGVSACYLVSPPGVNDLLPAMQPFLEQALEAGVQRFVLLSSSAIEAGGPLMGAIHAWLHQHAPEWVALRPSWFMQNFSEAHHAQTIAAQDTIFSATGKGRIAFIDAEDIAAVAAVALSDPDFPSGELILTGPQPLSYADVARILSQASGRDIRHENLSEADLADAYQRAGIAEEYAHALAALDGPLAAGAEDRVTPDVERMIGRPPTSFEDFAQRSAHAWRKT